MTSRSPIHDGTAQVADSYIRPTKFEIVAAWLHGRIPAPESGVDESDLPARTALEAAVLPTLLQAPCFVAFSGGRDSSAVLALATHLARRHGLPDPVPVTDIYPMSPESDEAEWQQLVIEHLGLRDWVRLTYVEGNDFLGPSASASLTARGVIWPPALHTKPATFAQLDDGSLLTGEGGDEVLGRRRGAQISRLWRRGKRLDGSALRSAAGAVAPASYRRRRVRASLDKSAMQPWLSDEVRVRHHKLLAADWTSEPLTTPRSLEWLLTRRSTAAAAHNHRVIAREFGLEMREPLLDPKFLRSFAREAGRWGFTSRTESMRFLFGDILPEAILERRSKAYFNRAFMGEETQAFARQWDGTGVNPQMVDRELLRAEWLSDTPSALSASLLQAAWFRSTAAEPTQRGEDG